MPWNSQNDNSQDNDGASGPWGSGQRDNESSPWSSGPQRSNGGDGSNDFEELFKRGQDRLKNVLPSGGGGPSYRVGIIVALVLAVIWGIFGGFYRVQPGEQAVELIFGSVIGLTGPGLNYNFPFPIGRVEKVNTCTLTSNDYWNTRKYI